MRDILAITIQKIFSTARNYVLRNFKEVSTKTKMLMVAAGGTLIKKIKGVNCSIRSVRFAFNSICLVQFSSFDLISSLFGLLRSKLLIVFAA